jgi:calcineurin-like phosphoesterase family protein
MNRTFVISDTHFNGKVYPHPNYTEAIFANWSTLVGQEDTIIHAGDVSAGKFLDVAPIIKSMPGRKILIKGNHDGSKNEKYLSAFDEVYSEPYIWENVVFSHFPVDTKIYKVDYNVFGHFHRYPSNMKDSLVRRYKDFYDFESNFTFCIHDWDYQPVEVQIFLKKCSDHAKLCV